jgi:hypothetical protein
MKHKKQFDVSINLITDDEPNAYIYRKKDMESCGSIFGTWYEKLIPLKKAFPQNRLIKHLTSSLWGHLTQYNKMNKTVEELDEGGYDWGITNDREWKILKHTIYHRGYDIFLESLRGGFCYFFLWNRWPTINNEK